MGAHPDTMQSPLVSCSEAGVSPTSPQADPPRSDHLRWSSGPTRSQPSPGAAATRRGTPFHMNRQPAGVTAERQMTPDGQRMKSQGDAELKKRRDSCRFENWATDCVLSTVRSIRRCL